MHITSLTPMLWTDDLAKTIEFYRSVLGFDCTSKSDGWAVLQHGDIELMISLPNAHEPYNGPQFTGSFYFRVTDVDTTWHTLRYIAPIVYDIDNFDYGMREFAIRDPNGYILQFGSPVT